jgi:hypothetical protein
MFKLLTEESRAIVSREYKLRRVVVIVTSLALVLSAALVGLFPSYILTKVKQSEAGALATPLQGEEDLEAWLKVFNGKLHALSAGITGAKASLDIEKVLSLKNSGVRITQMKWDEGEAGDTLSLLGIATDRQTLLSFEKRLKDSGKFSSVMLPVSNLAKERDINFQINLSFTP